MGWRKRTWILKPEPDPLSPIFWWVMHILPSLPPPQKNKTKKQQEHRMGSKNCRLRKKDLDTWAWDCSTLANLLMSHAYPPHPQPPISPPPPPPKKNNRNIGQAKKVVHYTGADPGFFSGGGASLRNDVSDGEVKTFKEGVHTPCTPPPPRSAPATVWFFENIPAVYGVEMNLSEMSIASPFSEFTLSACDPNISRLVLHFCTPLRWLILMKDKISKGHQTSKQH